MRLQNKLTFPRVQAILNSIKGMISKPTYKRIELLLTPCCTTTIESASFICDPNSPGNYIATIKLSNPINLLGKGIMLMFTNGVISIIEGTSNGLIPFIDGDTLILSALNIGPSTGATDAQINIFLMMPVTSDFPTSGNAVMLTPLHISGIDIPDCS